jgi:hypothetical protein
MITMTLDDTQAASGPVDDTTPGRRLISTPSPRLPITAAAP